MALPSTTPKFGDWGTNDQNFTVMFENVRAEKGSTQSVNLTRSSSNSSSSEQDGRDTRVEPEKHSSDRKSHEALPSPSPLPYPLSNRGEKSPNRVNPVSSFSTSSSEQDRKSTSRELGDVSSERKSRASSSSSPRLNPLSNRAYNRKDYEYIATFPRPLHGGYRADKTHGALDASDVSIQSSSTEYLGDNSATSFESLKEKEYQQRLNAHARSDVLDSSSEGRLELDGGSKENKRPPLSPLRNRTHEEKVAHEASLPAPARKIAGEAATQGKFRGLLASTGPHPAALPKFGDWNASKPYTQIFGQHRDEKLGGHPLQPLSLQPQTHETTKRAASQGKQWRVCTHFGILGRIFS